MLKSGAGRETHETCRPRAFREGQNNSANFDVIAVWSPVVADMAMFTRIYLRQDLGKRQRRVVAAVALEAPVKTSVSHSAI
jgi:hypothetical protein